MTQNENELVDLKLTFINEFRIDILNLIEQHYVANVKNNIHIDKEHIASLGMFILEVFKDDFNKPGVNEDE